MPSESESCYIRNRCHLSIKAETHDVSAFKNKILKSDVTSSNNSHHCHNNHVVVNGHGYNSFEGFKCHMSLGNETCGMSSYQLSIMKNDMQEGKLILNEVSFLCL